MLQSALEDHEEVNAALTMIQSMDQTTNVCIKDTVELLLEPISDLKQAQQGPLPSWFIPSWCSGAKSFTNSLVEHWGVVITTAVFLLRFLRVSLKIYQFVRMEDSPFLTMAALLSMVHRSPPVRNKETPQLSPFLPRHPHKLSDLNVWYLDDGCIGKDPQTKLSNAAIVRNGLSWNKILNVSCSLITIQLTQIGSKQVSSSTVNSHLS